MENNIHEMQRVLDAQKKHFINEGAPSIELRIDRFFKFSIWFIWSQIICEV